MKTFSEKSSRVQIVSLSVTLFLYLKMAYANYSEGFTETGGNLPLLLWSGLILILILVAGYIVVFATVKPEGTDERDLLIRNKAQAQTSHIYSAGCVLAVLGLALAINPLWILHLLVVTLFVAPIACEGLKLYYNKRGI